MSTKTAALVFGVGFALAGVAGFFPAPPPPGAPPLAVEHGHGLALGVLPVNTPHNIVHLLFAILGIAAWSGGWGRRYFQVLTVTYALLTVLGMIPATQTTFGLVPIWGNDVWFHAVITAVAVYYGFVRGNIDVTHRTPAHQRL